jgi:acyl-coenzyme A thioesterase PaaI-like protein
MTVHENWLKELDSLKSDKLTLPPPTLAELGLEYLEIEPGKSMVARVPFQSRFTNPVGLYQGGMLGACLDEVFGPLSYLTAGGPTLTLSMAVTYLGSFNAEHGSCHIKAVVLKKTKNFIFLRADVTVPEGDLIAHAETHVKVL